MFLFSCPPFVSTSISIHSLLCLIDYKVKWTPWWVRINKIRKKEMRTTLIWIQRSGPWYFDQSRTGSWTYTPFYHWPDTICIWSRLVCIKTARACPVHSSDSKTKNGTSKNYEAQHILATLANKMSQLLDTSLHEQPHTWLV